jgi:hypothetical protein
MNAHDFRRIALGLEGAIESAHMGHPDFRANGRIFATLHHDMKSGMVKLTPQEQNTFVKAQPDVFSLEAGAWGRSGCTKVHLALADEETIGEAMTLAWRAVTQGARVRRGEGAKVRKVRGPKVRRPSSKKK